MPRIKVRIVTPGKPDRVFDHELLRDHGPGGIIVSSFVYDGLPGGVFPVKDAGRFREAFADGDHGLLVEYPQGLEVIAVTRDGRLRGYYVNINLPYRRTEDGYEAKDLFLDVWVWADGGFTILDEDEFTEAKKASLITEDESRFANETLGNVVRMINFHRFPPKEVIEFLPVASAPQPPGK